MGVARAVCPLHVDGVHWLGQEGTGIFADGQHWAVCWVSDASPALVMSLSHLRALFVVVGPCAAMRDPIHVVDLVCASSLAHRSCGSLLRSPFGDFSTNAERVRGGNVAASEADVMPVNECEPGYAPCGGLQPEKCGTPTLDPATLLKSLTNIACGMLEETSCWSAPCGVYRFPDHVCQLSYHNV